MTDQPQQYQQHYSEPRFWEKLRASAKQAGREVVERALQLFYALQSSTMTMRERAIVFGALGYFILPFDVVPDILVGIGFADDLSVLLLAVKTISSHITPEVRPRAAAKAAEWFGENA